MPPLRTQTTADWNVRPQGESTSVFWIPPKLDEETRWQIAGETVEELRSYYR